MSHISQDCSQHKRILNRMAIAFVLVTLISCVPKRTPWRVTYLSEVANHATQDDVTMRLGAPHSSRILSDGRTVWTYRYYSGAVVGSAGNIVGSSACSEYILTFDQDNVLREWNRQRC